MPQIIPIKALKNTAEISDLCHSTDGPVYITKNGYGDMVLMSMESFEKMIRRFKMYEDIEPSEKLPGCGTFAWQPGTNLFPAGG